MNLRIIKPVYLSLLSLLAAFPLLPFALRSVIIILVLVLAIIYSVSESFNRPIKLGLIYALPFLVLLFSLSYSKMPLEGLKDIIQLLSFIILPLIFILYPVSIKSTKWLYKVFYSSVFFLVLYQATNLVVNIDTVHAEPSAQELKYNGITNILNADPNEIEAIKVRRFRTFVKSISNTHPTYQSIWIVFAVALCLFTWHCSMKKIEKTIRIVTMLIMVSWLFMLSSRMPILAGITAALIFGVKQSLKAKIIWLSIAVGLCFVSYLLIPSLNNRINEVYSSGLKSVNLESGVRQFNSTNIRLGIYSCGIMIHNKRPVIGYGVGGVQENLTDCLVSRINPKIYQWRTYGTHNQYLYMLLSTGYIGLVILLFWIFYLFKISFKHNLILFLFFFTFCLICMLTENILARNDGVLFFGLFTGILFFNPINRRYD